jgi:hypothetical protein
MLRSLILLLNANREELRDAVRALEERCVELEQERAAQHRQQQHQQQQQSAQALHSLEEAVQRNCSSNTAAHPQAESRCSEAPLKSGPDEEDDLDYEVIVDDLLQENEVSCDREAQESLASFNCHAVGDAIRYPLLSETVLRSNAFIFNLMVSFEKRARVCAGRACLPLSALSPIHYTPWL